MIPPGHLFDSVTELSEKNHTIVPLVALSFKWAFPGGSDGKESARNTEYHLPSMGI